MFAVQHGQEILPCWSKTKQVKHETSCSLPIQESDRSSHYRRGYTGAGQGSASSPEKPTLTHMMHMNRFNLKYIHILGIDIKKICSLIVLLVMFQQVVFSGICTNKIFEILLRFMFWFSTSQHVDASVWTFVNTGTLLYNNKTLSYFRADPRTADP